LGANGAVLIGIASSRTDSSVSGPIMAWHGGVGCGLVRLGKAREPKAHCLN
jgi:hypothetical protein